MMARSRRSRYPKRDRDGNTGKTDREGNALKRNREDGTTEIERPIILSLPSRFRMSQPNTAILNRLSKPDQSH